MDDELEDGELDEKLPVKDDELDLFLGGDDELEAEEDEGSALDAAGMHVEEEDDETGF